MCVCVLRFSVGSDSATLWTVARQPPLSVGILQARKLEGCHALLQGIFPTHGSNPGLQLCMRIFYHLNHQGSSRILEWVVCPFSRGFSDPGIDLGSPALQVDFLPAEPPRKPFTKSLQSCPTLYDPRDSSPPGSPIPGILQARTLEPQSKLQRLPISSGMNLCLSTSFSLTCVVLYHTYLTQIFLLAL